MVLKVQAPSDGAEGTVTNNGAEGTGTNDGAEGTGNNNGAASKDIADTGGTGTK